MPPTPDRSTADPFGTAALRDATLRAWRSSPTRMAEDAAAETELADIGYRGRLLTELAANAADAAGDDGVLWIRRDGDVLRFANTGTPLTRDGVESLTALRVSPKSHAATVTTVGRFGVGFRATAFAASVTVASTTGSIEFSRARTVSATGSQDSPSQRLAWPSAAEPPPGFSTEVSIDVGDDATALFEGFAAHVPDLLLELQALSRIELDDTVFTRTVEGDHVVIARDGAELQRWLTARVDGTSWMVRIVDGAVVPCRDEVLRSPTPTAVELALPARVITDLPLTPDRRDVHPDADVATAARGYADLVALAPDRDKHLLVPRPTVGSGRVDAELRSAILSDLADARWVPAIGGDALAPERTWVLTGLSDRLAEVLGEVMAPLAHPDVSDRVSAVALVRLGARELGLADIADLLGSTVREPAWWATLYAALADRVHTGDEREELGALPVPRIDGRTHIGARGLVVVDGLGSDDAAPDWMAIVHPDAYDPLLDRLGLEHCSIADVLADPALAAAIDSADDHAELADSVLRLLSAGGIAEQQPGLGRIEIKAVDGDDWPADELLLPDAPIANLLGDDSPFGVVAADVVERYGQVPLRALGVGWGFGTVHDDLPTGPDHDLPDEEQWWDEFEVPPERLDAVRDLDLVDPGRWTDALALLADDPSTSQLVHSGYTRWWLRRYAEIDGVPLRRLRSVDDLRFAGLFDVAPDSDRYPSLLVGDGPDDSDDAQNWIEALSDPERQISAGVAARAHAALVAAVRDGRVEPRRLEPPDGVRTLDGSVTERPVVIDQPWWTAVVPADRSVLPGPLVSESDAQILGDLLDADLASSLCRAVPVGQGRTVDADSAEAAWITAVGGRESRGPIVVHDRLIVAVDLDGEERHVAVEQWVDDAGTTHSVGWTRDGSVQR
ncbi:hypothetical protein SAMN04488550_0985 [Gordonia malaquae]|uniref:Uncharacterized protein n=1 Tax=Gordonia malaquae NBRC 108250 TaxID=1223542 RepID=M3UN43_GORML|nr:hypothetical protein [Gordonia malaquae]GAC81450.1 hypothetical protein GM1_034_00370 [Gordonia malaquae NBRC 108250]SEB89970.1 hypothetical protein SAMN04488550_0985 [Gordonia malaquae]